MQAFTSLFAEHRAIEPLVVGFKVALMQPLGDPAQVAAVRWRLVRALLDHFDHEDRDVCGSLLASGNAQAVAATLSFRESFGALRTLVLHYQQDWPSDRMERDWEGFCDASHALLAEVARRVESEERALYPEAARLLKLVPAPPAPEG